MPISSTIYLYYNSPWICLSMLANSRTRVSVRPSNFFICEKHPKLSRILRRIRDCLFEWSTDRSFIASGIGEKWALASSWLGAHRPIEQQQSGRRRRWVCVCVRVCMRACVHDVFAIYDNIIWHRLIMIIIKIIILYFLEITHTDDFPSTGTRLVYINICKKFLWPYKICLFVNAFIVHI